MSPVFDNLAKPFGKHSHSVTVLLVAATVLLLLVAGLFLVVGALLAFLVDAVDGKEGLHGALMVPALVLLVLILVLLLILLFRCCRDGDGKGLPREALAMLPMLGALPGVLRDTAAALRGTGDALGVVQANLASAGAQFDQASDAAAAATITVPIMGGALSTPGLFGVTGEQTLNPLAPVVEDLNTAGETLTANAQRVSEVRETLTTAATGLQSIATALGAPPQP